MKDGQEAGVCGPRESPGEGARAQELATAAAAAGERRPGLAEDTRTGEAHMGRSGAWGHVRCPGVLCAG